MHVFVLWEEAGGPRGNPHGHMGECAKTKNKSFIASRLVKQEHLARRFFCIVFAPDIDIFDLDSFQLALHSCMRMVLIYSTVSYNIYDFRATIYY